MYLVDEQDVALFEIGEYGGEVAGLLDGGTRGRSDIHAHLVSDDGGEGSLAETGRAVEQDMVEAVSALLRRLDIDGHILLDLLLTDILCESFRAEGYFVIIAVAFIRLDG